MIQDFEASLIAKKQLTEDVVEFNFKIEEGKILDFQPGQYVMLKVPLPDGFKKPKHYSIDSTNSQKDGFTLLVKIFPGGLASGFLQKLNIGDKASFWGPAGMFLLKQSNKPKIFLATGTGIAPILSILRSKILDLGLQTYLFWGLKTSKDVYYQEELKKLVEENPKLQFKIFLSREQSLNSNGEFALGRVNKGLDDLLKQLKPTDFDFYICGDRDIVESLRQYVISMGVDPQVITFEKFV